MQNCSSNKNLVLKEQLTGMNLNQKYQQKDNQYLDYLTDASFQGVKRLFVLSFEDEAQQISYKRYYLPTVEVKNYNITIDGQNFFDQPVGNNLITYGNVYNIATGQGDDYITSCLLDYNISKTNTR